MVLDKAVEESVWRGAELHVVHVARVPMVYSEIPYDPSSISKPSALPSGSDWARQLKGPVSRCKGSISMVPARGPGALRLWINAELLVVGTRGRGISRHFVLGSTSHNVVHLAGCDVLVVKAASTH